MKQTKEFYALQPKITENCSCDDCRYFETEVIHQSNKLFEMLKDMGVDLSRQPNINPDGVCGIDHDDKIGFWGYYFVYGTMGKASKSTRKTDDDSIFTEVSFNDAEFGKNTQVTIKQVEPNKLSFDFYILVEKQQI